MDVDAFYQALDLCYLKVDTAIDSKCNMNQKVRDEARNAMSELKSLIVKNFEFIRSFKYREACKESIVDILGKGKHESSSDVPPSVGDADKLCSSNPSMEDMLKELKNEFVSFRMDISTKVETIAKHICSEPSRVNKTSLSSEFNGNFDGVKNSENNKVPDLQTASRLSYADKLKVNIPLRNDKFTGSKSVINGSKKDSDIKSVKRLPRRKAAFVSRLSPETSVKDISDFLGPLGFDFLSCHKLKTKFQSYSSFHIQVYESDFYRLMDESTWPEGCIVTEFFGKLRKDQIFEDNSMSSGNINSLNFNVETDK